MATVRTEGKWQGMNWIRQEKRLAIYLRDKFTCAYCRQRISQAAHGECTLDHVQAHTNGGTNHESNLVLACHTCNSARQARPVAEFCPSAMPTIAVRTAQPLKPYLYAAKAKLAARAR